MKIHPNTPQGKEVQKIFLNLIHDSEYKRISDFAREHNLPYHKVYLRLFQKKRWINLDHVNELVQLIDKRKKIMVVGDTIKLGSKFE